MPLFAPLGTFCFLYVWHSSCCSQLCHYRALGLPLYLSVADIYWFLPQVECPDIGWKSNLAHYRLQNSNLLLAIHFTFMTYKQTKLYRTPWTCSFCIPPCMFQFYKKLDYIPSQDLSCPMLGLVSMGLVRMGPPWCLGKISGMSCLWAHTHGIRLRVDKPGYYFPWIVLCPQGCHVQGKHFTCTHGRASILVLALWGKAMCWAGKLRFQTGVCTQIWPLGLYIISFPE